MADPSQIEPAEPGHAHRRIDDRFQQPVFHHLESLGLLRSGLGLAMIDEQPRQIEHAGHPGDDPDHMQGFDPFVHRLVSLVSRSLIKSRIAESLCESLLRARSEYISAKQVFSKLIILES